MDIYVKTVKTAEEVVNALQMPDDNATDDKLDD